MSDNVREFQIPLTGDDMHSRNECHHLFQVVAKAKENIRLRTKWTAVQWTKIR